jgi:hypothetical protein
MRMQLCFLFAKQQQDVCQMTFWRGCDLHPVPFVVCPRFISGGACVFRRQVHSMEFFEYLFEAGAVAVTALPKLHTMRKTSVTNR